MTAQVVVNGQPTLLVHDEKARRLAERILVLLMEINRRMLRARHGS